MSVLTSELVQKVDQYIDQNHDRFSELGRELFGVFGFDEKKSRVRTQVRNLQQVACSATRFADIEDFVKNQMGKEKVDRDHPAQWKAVGPSMLNVLEELRSWSQRVEETTPQEQFAIRLRLARGWIQAVVSEYLYVAAQHQMGAIV